MTRQDGLVNCWMHVVARCFACLLAALVLFVFAQPSLGQAARTAPRSSRTPSVKSKSVQAKSRSAHSKTEPGRAGTRPASNSQQAVVARVNGQEISGAELATECLRRYGGDVLESVINKHLILQECKRKQIQITQRHVDDEIVKIAQKFSLPVERWVELLQNERNISLTQYRNDIVWPTLALRRLSADRLKISEDELNREFESEYGAKVQVRMISTTSEEKAKALLTRVQAKPDEFGRIAKDESEDKNSAAARGLIPPIRRHVGDKALEEVAFGMQPGAISPVLRVHDQFIIVKCERHVPPTHIAPQYQSEARSRLADRLRERKLRSVAGKLFQEMQTRAKIVNVYNDPKLSKQMPGVAATVNGVKVSIVDLKQACFDRHAVDVLDGEINHRILKQALAQQKLQVAQDDIDGEIRRAADSFGFNLANGQPDVKRWLKEVTEQEGMSLDLYVRDAVWPTVALKKLVTDKVEVSKEDLDKAFQANYGERVEVLAIVLSNQRTAQEVWKMARANDSKAYFGQLANQYSVEPVSRSNFGEVPPIGRFGGQPLVEREAFKLKQGELSGIVSTGDKFVILRCLGRTEPIVDDLKAVQSELSKAVFEKKLRVAMAEEFDRLKDSAKVQNMLATKPRTAPGRVKATPVSNPRTKPTRAAAANRRQPVRRR